MKLMRRLMVACLSFALMSGVAFTEEKPNVTARALFYSGEGTTIASHSQSKVDTAEVKTTRSSQTASASNTQKYMGIAYWIDKVRHDGTVVRVNANSTFYSGDKIRLYVETNRDGYLYVINIGSTGRTNVLFPTRSTVSNYVRAYQPVAIPQNGYIRFDHNPGTEKILILLSPYEMNLGPSSSTYTAVSYEKLDYVKVEAQRNPADNYGLVSRDSIPQTEEELNKTISGMRVAARDLFVEEVTTPVSTQGYAARDLVVEEGTPIRYDMPATYVVSPLSSFEGGKVISHEIRLRHK